VPISQRRADPVDRATQFNTLAVLFSKPVAKFWKPPRLRRRVVDAECAA
jgi:hypothetical protein